MTEAIDLFYLEKELTSLPKLLFFLLYSIPELMGTEGRLPQTSLLYNQIRKNAPEISHLNAHKLSITINKTARQYNLSPKLLSAIIAQESRYKLNAINYISRDYGIGQINYRTARYYRLDEKRLLTDLEYSIRAATLVLSDLRSKYAHREVDYWTRYNSSHPKARARYKKLVLTKM